ncbi:SRPBCC family protein [Jatrophihabitans sp.]|uniref:SRPBCC family protein n=1 Tax=Jatrophihabitans sp. TaxID=1932789 RepID=UPI002EE3217F
MSDRSFTTAISVSQSPQQAFDAINNVSGWWSGEIEGDTSRVGDEFLYRHEELHRCKLRVTEAVPGRKVSWYVVDNYFSFTKDKTEWTNTTIQFEISAKAGGTEIRFTHLGLVPEYECFDACSDGWGFYINSSLRNLIATGEGQRQGTSQTGTSAEEMATQ